MAIYSGWGMFRGKEFISERILNTPAPVQEKKVKATQKKND
jgi:hypothetical protein